MHYFFYKKKTIRPGIAELSPAPSQIKQRPARKPVRLGLSADLYFLKTFNGKK